MDRGKRRWAGCCIEPDDELNLLAGFGGILNRRGFGKNKARLEKVAMKPQPTGETG